MRPGVIIPSSRLLDLIIAYRKACSQFRPSKQRELAQILDDIVVVVRAEERAKPGRSSAHAVAALTNDQVLDLMRQPVRTTVAEFRSLLVTTLDTAKEA